MGNKPATKKANTNINILICGVSGVGKLSLANRFIYNEFKIPEFAGLSDQLMKEVEGPLRTKILARLMHTSLSTDNQVEIDFIKECNVCIFVFSYDSKESLEALPNLYNRLNSMENDNMLRNTYLCGNKSDIVEGREVLEADIANLRTIIRTQATYEVSAITGDGTQVAFSNICKRRVRTRYVAHRNY